MPDTRGGARDRPRGVMGLSVEVVRKPRKPLPKEVAKRWAKEGKEVSWQTLMPPRGFRVLPRRRWVVERTFAWGSATTGGLWPKTTRGYAPQGRLSSMRR